MKPTSNYQRVLRITASIKQEVMRTLKRQMDLTQQLHKQTFHFLSLNFDPTGGPHSTVDSILASRPAASGLILGIPNFFQRKN